MISSIRLVSICFNTFCLISSACAFTHPTRGTINRLFLIPYLCYVYQVADAREILEKEVSEPFGLTTLLYQGFVGEKKEERAQLVDLFAEGEDEKEIILVGPDEKGIKADISVNP